MPCQMDLNADRAERLITGAVHLPRALVRPGAFPSHSRLQATSVGMRGRSTSSPSARALRSVNSAGV